MGSMKLYSEGVLSITGISNIFLDEYMPEANGEFVKVYLYLVRCMGDSSKVCGLSAIADALNHTETDIMRALTYWERQNIINIDYNEDNKPIGIALLPLQSKASMSASVNSGYLNSTSSLLLAQEETVTRTAAPYSAVAATTGSTFSEPARREYSINEISSYREDPEIQELFFVIEAYMKKPLTVTQINNVLYWYDVLGFSNDLIDYLVEYCVNKGHYSFRYMDRIALDWYENRIFTVEAAKADSESHNKTNYAVIKALGISGRDLAQSEKANIARWTEEWHFELPLIEEACRRTIEATHQPSFAYADKVLETWRRNGVKTLKDVEALDAAFAKDRKISIRTSEAPKRNKFTNIDSRNNNYDEMEQLLVHRPV